VLTIKEAMEKDEHQSLFARDWILVGIAVELK
jgi:hypothetical protein